MQEQLEQQMQLDKDSIEREKQEAERLRVEHNKHMEDQREKMRIERERLEQEKLVLEQQNQLERESFEREKREAEEHKKQLEKERLEKEKLKMDQQQQRGHRLALLIGNSDYKHAGVLSNPINDVLLITSRLKDVGFEVTTVQDVATKDEMEDEVDNFGMKLSDAGKKLECCLLYYAGHGMQCQEVNYLIPTSVNITCESDVKRKCLNLSHVVEKLSEISDSNSVQVMIFDACRNNLSTRSWRSATRSKAPEGLCNIDASGSFVMFSTAPGTKALDTCNESNDSSPFALALSRAMQPGMELYKLYRTVTADVKRMTNKMQNPYLSSSLDSDFLL